MSKIAKAPTINQAQVAAELTVLNMALPVRTKQLVAELDDIFADATTQLVGAYYQRELEFREKYGQAVSGEQAKQLVSKLRRDPRL